VKDLLPDRTVRLDAAAQALVRDGVHAGRLHLVVGPRSCGDPAGYRDGELWHRDLEPALVGCPVLFLKVDPTRTPRPGVGLDVRGIDVGGYPVLRVGATAVPDALALVALHLRDTTGVRPHLHFTPPCGSGLAHGLRYAVLARTARRTCALLRAADPARGGRPVVHLDG
jgi:hypothetical protein